jgi:RNA polymerase sigma factor (sigma-70 family)
MAASVNYVLGQLQRWTAAQTVDETDAVLLQRYIHQRDDAAFAALVARHGAMVLRVCRRILGDGHHAEDAFQAAFLILARKAASLRQPEALTGWLHGVARRVALKACGQGKGRLFSAVPLNESLPDPHTDPLAQLTARELLGLVDEEVQRLPAAQRSVVVLCCLEGCTRQEAARQLGWTLPSVKSHLQRGRQRLQERLRRRGIALSAALAVVAVSRGEAAPALLLRSTVAAALSGGIDGSASALATSVLKAMFLPKLAGVMAVVLTFALVASATVAWVSRSAPAEAPEDKPPAAIAPKQPDDKKPQARTDAQDEPLPKGAIARLGTLRLRGCQGPVVFSPDGKYIVAAGGDGGTQAVFWDIGTGRRVKTLTVEGTISRLAFSPDGKQLAAVNAGSFNPVWDAASGAKLFTFQGGEVAFHADGKKLVSIYGTADKIEVRTIDAATGRPLTEWTLAHPSERGFALSPDGRFAAVPLKGAGGVLAVFDLTKRAEVKSLRFTQGGLHASAFSSDGLRLVVSGQEGFRVWEWSSGKVLRRWAGSVRTPPALSRDGRRFAWSGADKSDVNSVWIADVEAGQPRPLRAMTFNNWGDPMAFSSDGKRVAVLTEGNAVVLLDSRTGRDLLPLAAAAHDGRIWRVAYSSDGRQVITCDPNRVLVWEGDTGRMLRRLPDDLPEGETILLNTAAHGRIVTVVLADGTLRLRDVATGKELRKLKGKDGYITNGHWDVSAVSEDGSSVAILGPAGIRIYDLNTGEIRCQFTRDHPIWGMHFSADGRTLIVTIQDFQKGLLPRYHDARTGRQVEAPADAETRKKRGGRWREDTEEAKARLQGMKLLDAKGKLAFAGEDVYITGVYASPGGRYLAAEGRTGLPHVIDKTNKGFLRVWDTPTRRLVLNLDGPQGGTNIAGFSRDGRTLISTSHWPGTIHFWETATGHERLSLAGHRLGDVTVTFRPDGRVLVSGAADTQGFLWDVTGRSPDGIRRETRHSPERLRQLWDTLAGDDAANAYRAMWSLVDAPAQAVPWLREHLPPLKPVEPAQLVRLIDDLDSDKFAVRSKASEELERLGELAEPALRGALAAKPTLERRRRCEELLAKLSVLSSRRLRAVRTVEVLEHIGTAEARALVEKLAGGTPQARQTQEARAARQRLAVAP